MEFKTNSNIIFVADYKVDGIDNHGTLEDVLEYCKKYDILGLDIETSRKYKEGLYDERIYKGGLDPYLSRICVLQIGTVDKSYVIDVRRFTNEELKPLIDFLNWNKDVMFVGQNLKFEGRHLLYNYGIRLHTVWDCMLVEINLTNGNKEQYSLAALSKKYLGVQEKKEQTLFDDGNKKKVITLNQEYLEENLDAFTPFDIADDFQLDKSTRLQFVKLGNKKLNYQQIAYSADDIVFPLLIREKQMMGRMLMDRTVYNPQKLHRLENTFSQVLAEIENAGVRLDREEWISVATHYEGVYKERQDKLEDYVLKCFPHYGTQYNLFDENKHDFVVEWTSSKQVIAFFKVAGEVPKEYSTQTKKEEYTVSASALLKTLTNDRKEAYMRDDWQDFPKDESGKYIYDFQDLVLAYLLLKKVETSITTFGRDFLKYVHPITGKVHAPYVQILSTGRMSSRKPNLLNIKGGKHRTCFKAEKGHKLLNADYSSQELRVLADKSQDPLFLSFFNDGHEFYGSDFHAYSATMLFALMRGQPDLVVPPKGHDDFGAEENDMRTKAKVLSFSLAYGKAQPLDSQVLTEHGWVKFSDVEIGMKVFTQDGTLTTITEVKPVVKQPTYKVTMQDGSITKCSESHLWTYQTLYDKRKGVYRTEELIDIIPRLKQGTQNNCFIAYPQALILPKKDLSIHPYILGAYLGDGHECCRITLGDAKTDVVNKIRKLLPKEVNLVKYKKDYSYGFKTETCRNVKGQFTKDNPITNGLRSLGLEGKGSLEKFIPNEYLFSSKEQRELLLKGLLDTDGSKNHNSWEYSTSSKQLAEDVKFLAKSLGARVSVSSRYPKYQGGVGKLSYRVFISFPPVAQSNSIKSIEYVGEELCRCISVEDESGLYITDDFIVTHNSPKGFSDDFGITIEEAEELIDSYLGAYEGLNKYFESQKKKASKQFYIVIDVLDRRWFYEEDYKRMQEVYNEVWTYYPDDYRTLSQDQKAAVKAEIRENYPIVKELWKKFFGTVNAIQRKFLNYPIQGSASSILKVSLCSLRKYRVENDELDLLPILLVHDEVVGDSPEEKAERHGEILTKYMISGSSFISPSVKMEAECVVSDIWGH
jgi:DNA polymerase I-like protein with 3'-5' exonuclease and polymerase domains